MTAPRDDRPIGELFADLSAQTSRLIRSEIQLAIVEVRRSVTELARESAVIGAGGALAYAGLIVLLFGVGALLADVFNLPLWVGLLLVGVVVVAIGGFLAYRSLAAIRKARLVPERTMATIRDDVDWAKEQTR